MKTIHLKRMPKAEDPCAPQARVLLEVLGHAKNGMTMPELTKAASGKLKTKQTVGAVFGHYAKDLRKRGYITMTESKSKKEQ